MPRLHWEVRNFSLGMHTDLARAGAGGERFAREASGVRVDENGHLRPRAAVKQVGEDGEHAVTGVVSGADFLLYLRADSSLWIRFADNPDTDGAIRFSVYDQISRMAGALSLVADFADFIIVKARGGPPYWIDMRPDSNDYLTASRLGILPPSTIPPSVQYLPSEDGEPSVLLRGFIYFYRWTYVRATGDNAFKIRDGVYHQVGTLFNGMESNPSPAMGVYRDLGDDVELVDVIDNDGNRVDTVFAAGTANDVVSFNWADAQSEDPQVTGIMLYQSEPVDALKSLQLGTINVDALQYRRIDYIPRTQESSTTGQTARPDRWPDMPLLRFDNDVMPATERIVLYNDRIFAPTDKGLRYSDVDGTVLRLWAFPEVNAIRRAGIKDCVSHRGVLLFGGPADLHSVTGASAYDFVVNRLGTLGPVSPHAMQVLKDSVAFAGSSGFYITDTVQVQKISEALDTEFEAYETTYGHCHQLPDESLMFIVQQQHDIESPRRLTFHFDSGAWFEWPRFNIQQVARWRTPGTRVMLADEKYALRELVWKITPGVADDDAADADDLIDWHWESQRLNFGTEAFKQFRELQMEGQALSVVTESEQRWPITHGEQTIVGGKAWRLFNIVFGIGDKLWGTAEVAAPVRLTVWVDDSPAQYHVFEMRRNDLRPLRIPLNRTGKAIKFRLEGRGHIRLQGLTLIGGMR